MISNIQAEQQAIIEGRRIVETIFIQDEGSRQGTDFQQVMPIERAACETGDFQAHHQSHMTQPDLGDQALRIPPDQRQRLLIGPDLDQ